MSVSPCVPELETGPGFTSLRVVGMFETVPFYGHQSAENVQETFRVESTVDIHRSTRRALDGLYTLHVNTTQRSRASSLSATPGSASPRPSGPTIQQTTQPSARPASLALCELTRFYRKHWPSTHHTVTTLCATPSAQNVGVWGPYTGKPSDPC